MPEFLEFLELFGFMMLMALPLFSSWKPFATAAYRRSCDADWGPKDRFRDTVAEPDETGDGEILQFQHLGNGHVWTKEYQRASTLPHDK